jgi:hypothetical protein
MTDEVLEICTTIGCKQACNYCPQKLVTSRYASGIRVMAWDTYFQILDNVPPRVEISFAGFTEPWQNLRCTDMVQMAATAAHVVSVFTTGVSMTPQDVARLKGIPFHHFCLHLPDATQRMHCTVDENYLATINTLKAVIPNLTYMCVGPVHPLVKLILDPMDWTGSLNSRGGNMIDVGEPMHKTGPLCCTACPGLRHNVVLPDGTVVLCCMDYGLQNPLGDLTIVPYDKLFEGEGLLSVRRRMDSQYEDIICRSCYASAPATK